MPNLNSHMEWSGMDQADLEHGLARGDPVEDLAAFLCRDVEEIEAKIAETRPKSGEAKKPDH